MLSESYSQLQRRLLEDKITKELNHIGITLGTEDYLSFKIDAEGQIYVQDKYSHLEGRDVQKASGAIENALNESQYEGEPLGEALLKNFAQEQGIDLEQARQDDSFSVSFTFRYNAQTGRHEIGNVSFSSENKVQDSLIQNLFEELIESRENADEEKQNGPKETA